jgi:hypothetical protein
MNLDLTFASIQKITSFLNYFQPISIYRRKWFKIVFHPSGRSTFALDYICVDYVDAEKRSFATQRRVVSQTTRKKGGNKGIRTLGLCLAKAPLYQLSYIPFFCKPLFVSHCLCTCVDVVIHPSIRPSIHKVEKRKSGEAEKLRSGEVEKRRSGLDFVLALDKVVRRAVRCHLLRKGGRLRRPRCSRLRRRRVTMSKRRRMEAKKAGPY